MISYDVIGVPKSLMVPPDHDHQGTGPASATPSMIELRGQDGVVQGMYHTTTSAAAAGRCERETASLVSLVWIDACMDGWIEPWNVIDIKCIHSMVCTSHECCGRGMDVSNLCIGLSVCLSVRLDG